MLLVTGGSGLLGHHLLEALVASGQKVRATYRNQLPKSSQQFPSESVEWVLCDITDLPSLEEAFEGITQVYHCAGIVSYDPRMKEHMMEVNVTGTEHIVNVCLDKKIQKLVHVSSIATLSDGIAGELITEKNDWEESPHHSNYSISKQAAEMEVWRGIAEGLNAVIINPGIILGEGDDTKGSTNLFKIVHNEFPFYTKGSTAWVDVKDVVRSMIALMNSTISNERFIISAGNYSYHHIFQLMAHAMNKKPPHQLASPFMTELVWRFAYLKSKLMGRSATITKETARSAHQIKRYDASKLLKALPDFSYTDIELSIKQIAKKYLNH